MITRVIKRDGREAVFNIEKIANAIHKALDASAEVSARDPNRLHSQISMDLSALVAERLDQTGNNRPTIEQIQDAVEHVLMENGYPETAKRYIIYRAERTRVREMKTHLMQTFHAMNPLQDSARQAETAASAIVAEARLQANPESAGRDTPRNAGEHLLQYGLTGAQSYNMLYLLRPEVSQAHQNRDLYIHDLEYYALTFADFPIDLKRLFAGGFSSGDAPIREPGDIRSYAALAGVAVASAQAEISGHPTLVHFDRAMAAGVQATRQRLTGKYAAILEELESKTPANRQLTKPAGEMDQPAMDERVAKLADADTEQATFLAMESMLHLWNTSSFRTPSRQARLSIQYGLETSESARLVTRQLLQATLQGLGGHADVKQPQQMFLLAEGINLAPADPNYDLFKLACRCCTVRGNPQFAFADPAARSLATVSINLTRCAILARSDLNLFYHRLENQLDLAIKSLIERLTTLQSIRRRNFPFIIGQVAADGTTTFTPNETMAEILADGYLMVSFVGLAETLTSLVGRHHGQREDAARLGLEIVRMMRDYCDEASEKNGLQIRLQAGQDSGVACELVTADRARFGRIAGVTDISHYTAGFCLPTRQAIPVLERIRIEAPYHQLVQSGQILTIDLPVNEDDPAAAIEGILHSAAAAKIKQVSFRKK